MEGRERFHGAESVCGDRERTKHEHALKCDLTPQALLRDPFHARAKGDGQIGKRFRPVDAMLTLSASGMVVFVRKCSLMCRDKLLVSRY